MANTEAEAFTTPSPLWLSEFSHTSFSVESCLLRGLESVGSTTSSTCFARQRRIGCEESSSPAATLFSSYNSPLAYACRCLLQAHDCQLITRAPNHYHGGNKCQSSPSLSPSPQKRCALQTANDRLRAQVRAQ